ncbi:MAG TPA: hypothetical protein EYP77_03245 [Anaerolineae bacterium]|nr:hypothetical protein [Anaerolineae bacterium]
MIPSERDNIARWDGLRRGFHEVYYLKLNDLNSGTALLVRYTLLVPRQGVPVAELWAVFFDHNDPTSNLVLKRTYPIIRAAIRRDPFCFRVGEAVLRHHRATGGLADEAGSITWDLSWEPSRETFYHFPRPALYKGAFPGRRSWPPVSRSVCGGAIRSTA